MDNAIAIGRYITVTISVVLFLQISVSGIQFITDKLTEWEKLEQEFETQKYQEGIRGLIRPIS